MGDQSGGIPSYKIQTISHPLPPPLTHPPPFPPPPTSPHIQTIQSISHINITPTVTDTVAVNYLIDILMTLISLILIRQLDNWLIYTMERLRQ